MAKSTVTKYKCDRCGRDYLESEPVANDPKAAKIPQPAVMVEACLTNGTCSPVVVKFDDLCPKCDARCADLIAQMALDDTGSKKDKAGKDEEKSAEGSLDAKPKASDNKKEQDAGKAADKPATTH